MTTQPPFEKYGVVQNDTSKPKTASQDQTGVLRCPDCNAILRDTTTRNVYLCPNCGTKPFEPNVDA